MRVLHTSDWHLGVTMKRQSCHREQAAFLDWLLEQIDAFGVQVLVVAGDVFHQATPSNRAQELYFRFLARCFTQTGLLKAVVVAGNHDSPSGLEAPRSLLDELDIHVVGGRTVADKTRRDWLVPIEGESGEVEFVVCAVPYISEARLGIGHRLEEGETSLQQRSHDAFRELYSDLAEEARQRWPEARLIATGHLTCFGEGKKPQPGDYHTPLHRSGPADGSYTIGTIGAFPPDVFDDAFEYVALGHIHRCFPPADGDRRIWYSGTPVPTSRKELSTRRIIIADFDDPDSDSQSPSVELIEVPRWREIYVLEGSGDELLKQLDDVEGDSDFPPYLFVHATLEEGQESSEPQNRLQEAIDERFEADDAPKIVEYRARNSTAATDVSDQELTPLEELSPMEVFLRLYEAQYHSSEPPAAMVDSFQTVLDEFHDGEKT